MFSNEYGTVMSKMLKSLGKGGATVGELAAKRVYKKTKVE